MNAMEELRALLDERGIEWWEEDGHTLWRGHGSHVAQAMSSFAFGDSERLHVTAMLTPAQAVGATLGPGACRNLSKYVNWFECSCCGWTHDFVTDPYSGPSYCPGCGRRVEDA